jgi:hypothetical protein
MSGDRKPNRAFIPSLALYRYVDEVGNLGEIYDLVD